MKKRTKLLALLQDNISLPDRVYYNHLNKTIVLSFYNDKIVLVNDLVVNIINDDQIGIDLQLAKKIDSIYDLPALSRANTIVELIERWNSVHTRFDSFKKERGIET